MDKKTVIQTIRTHFSLSLTYSQAHSHSHSHTHHMPMPCPSFSSISARFGLGLSCSLLSIFWFLVFLCEMVCLVDVKKIQKREVKGRKA